MSRFDTASLIIPVPSIGGRIETRRHLSAAHHALEAVPVTLGRAPWEPEVTVTCDRIETRPDPRITLCRRAEHRQAARSRITQIIAAIRAAHHEATA